MGSVCTAAKHSAITPGDDIIGEVGISQTYCGRAIEFSEIVAHTRHRYELVRLCRTSRKGRLGITVSVTQTGVTLYTEN